MLSSDKSIIKQIKFNKIPDINSEKPIFFGVIGKKTIHSMKINQNALISTEKLYENIKFQKIKTIKIFYNETGLFKLCYGYF